MSQKFAEDGTSGLKWEYIDSIEKDPYSLEVYECKCGFHIGLDGTYIEQVGNVKIKCPSCGEKLNTKHFL